MYMFDALSYLFDLSSITMYSDLLYMDTTGTEASIQVTKLSVIQTEVETVWSLVSLVSKYSKCRIQ